MSVEYEPASNQTFRAEITFARHNGLVEVGALKKWCVLKVDDEEADVQIWAVEGDVVRRGGKDWLDTDSQKKQVTASLRGVWKGERSTAD